MDNKKELPIFWIIFSLFLLVLEVLFIVDWNNNTLHNWKYNIFLVISIVIAYFIFNASKKDYYNGEISLNSFSLTIVALPFIIFFINLFLCFNPDYVVETAQEPKKIYNTCHSHESRNLITWKYIKT